jgi:hypothetical protein
VRGELRDARGPRSRIRLRTPEILEERPGLLVLRYDLSKLSDPRLSHLVDRGDCMADSPTMSSLKTSMGLDGRGRLSWVSNGADAPDV